MNNLKMAFISVVMFSLSAFATDGSTTIKNSDLSTENQIVVANAIQSSTCGYIVALEQVAPTIQVVDYQEVGDVFLKIKLTGKQILDQNQSPDEYMIYVDAVIPAVHSNGTVLAQVTNVRCEIK